MTPAELLRKSGKIIVRESKPMRFTWAEHLAKRWRQKYPDALVKRQHVRRLGGHVVRVYR